MVMLGGAGGAYRDFFHPENDDALWVRALGDQTAELGAMLYSSMLYGQKQPKRVPSSPGLYPR